MRSLLAVTSAFVACSAAIAASPPATQVIERLNATLFETLKDAEKLGFDGRLAKLTPAVGAAFDVEFMAEKSIGKHWKPLSDADKARWVALFKEFTAANYAGNLKKFSGQRFEISGEEPSGPRVTHPGPNDPGCDPLGGDAEPIASRRGCRRSDGPWRTG